MNLAPYVFDVDHVAKIRSELSITVLEKNEQNYRLKKWPNLLESFWKDEKFGGFDDPVFLFSNHSPI